jgi:hypothetical protein
MSIMKIIAIAVLLLVGSHLLLYGYLKRRIAAAKAAALALPLVEVAGGCHCGAVRFTFFSKPHVTLLDCNCSICSATAYLHLNIPHSDFTPISGKDALSSYRFGTGAAEHLFCKHCGVKSFYQPRSHPDCWSVNFRCLDEGHPLIEIIQPFDGQNWEAAKGDLD